MEICNNVIKTRTHQAVHSSFSRAGCSVRVAASPAWAGPARDLVLVSLLSVSFLTYETKYPLRKVAAGGQGANLT